MTFCEEQWFRKWFIWMWTFNTSCVALRVSWYGYPVLTCQWWMPGCAKMGVFLKCCSILDKWSCLHIPISYSTCLVPWAGISLKLYMLLGSFHVWTHPVGITLSNTTRTLTDWLWNLTLHSSSCDNNAVAVCKWVFYQCSWFNRKEHTLTKHSRFN
jgi:hypothetical protein